MFQGNYSKISVLNTTRFMLCALLLSSRYWRLICWEWQQFLRIQEEGRNKIPGKHCTNHTEWQSYWNGSSLHFTKISIFYVFCISNEHGENSAFLVIPIVTWLAWLDFMQSVHPRPSFQKYLSDPINKFICSLVLQNQWKKIQKIQHPSFVYFHKISILNLRNFTPYFYFLSS